jgi:integrative and conjugative element protein (TIGR02256 family)
MSRSVSKLRYAIGGVRKFLVFSEDVLRHFDQHRQRHLWHAEAGGQLFAQFGVDIITVVSATGPHSADRRSRFRFTPHRERERQDVEEHFASGLHFIGNWHTHPQADPQPSATDVRNTRQRFIQSDHELLAFTMVVVGLDPFPRGLWVGLIDARETTVLDSACFEH